MVTLYTVNLLFLHNSNKIFIGFQPYLFPVLAKITNKSIGTMVLVKFSIEGKYLQTLYLVFFFFKRDFRFTGKNARVFSLLLLIAVLPRQSFHFFGFKFQHL